MTIATTHSLSRACAKVAQVHSEACCSLPHTSPSAILLRLWFHSQIWDQKCKMKAARCSIWLTPSKNRSSLEEARKICCFSSGLSKLCCQSSYTFTSKCKKQKHAVRKNANQCKTQREFWQHRCSQDCKHLTENNLKQEWKQMGRS